ncbi:unnamed protein product [Prorocentrum cordatum]|uniref:Uncharacterized protein n=1 Tax=Prorocentrum cordatum TaxID=2364126 RepID=A0ABN9YIM6_9DINO|nr:unnamed protein product [Polarella glacialis]
MESLRMSVQETVVKEVDAVFSGVKGLFDALVGASNSIFADAKAIPGAEGGSGLQDAIASAVCNGQGAMMGEKPFLCCVGGGSPAAKVGAGWDKLKKGNVEIDLPKFDTGKLPASHRRAIEKLMGHAQTAIDIAAKAFKQVSGKIAKEEIDNPSEIFHEVMMCADNVKIADLIVKVISCVFATFTSIAKAIKGGFEHGHNAIEARVAPISKAPKMEQAMAV